MTRAREFISTADLLQFHQTALENKKTLESLSLLHSLLTLQGEKITVEYRTIVITPNGRK